MTMNEEALTRAALECAVDLAAFRPLFDALAVADSTPALLEDLRARFTDTLGADVARALLDGTLDAAEVARRGERLIRIQSIQSIQSIR